VAHLSRHELAATSDEEAGEVELQEMDEDTPAIEAGTSGSKSQEIAEEKGPIYPDIS